MDEKQLVLVFSLFVVFFINLQISFAQDVPIGCCTEAEDISAYCIEFDTLNKAIDAGCSVGGYIAGVSCEQTECSFRGCCPLDCSFKEKSDCFGGDFFPFEQCNSVPACQLTCCVVDGQPFESSAYDGESFCSDRGGVYYPGPCADMEPGGAFGSLTGLVTDTNNQPLANVQVYAGPYIAVTTAAGRYNFVNIPVSYPNYYSLKAYFIGYTQVDPVSAIVVRDSLVEADTIRLTSDPNSFVVIRGRVVNQFNLGIASAIVSFDNSFSTYTDVQGYYEIKAQVPSGNYVIDAKKAGFISSSQNLDVETGLRYDGIDFTITPGSAQDLCGNGVLDPEEDCDPPFDSACPGRCQPDCSCPPKCEELGYFCADVGYQCDNVNGQRIAANNLDCVSDYNQNIPDGGICCNIEPTPLPECIYGEVVGNPDISYTDVLGSGGNYCKCGDYIGSVTDSSLYCCVVDGDRKLQSNVCAPPGNVRGYVYSSTGPLDDVRLELSSIYQTRSNSSSTTNFEFQNVAPGTYAITAQRAGFRDYSGTIVVTSGGVINFNILMQPIQGLDTDFGLTLSHVKGEPYVRITITASDISAINHYNIYKNGHSDSHLFMRVDKSDITNTYVFIDTSTSWKTSYTYNVTAYSVYDKIATDTKTLVTGDSACEGVYDTQQFCGSSLCFSTKIKQNCGENDNAPFKYRLICNNNNALSFPDSPSASTCTDSCVEVSPGFTTCAGSELCREIGLPPFFGDYSQSGNFFGLFYFENFGGEQCEVGPGNSYKFCYEDFFYSNIFDRRQGSYTHVNQCVRCQPEGFCYDYQSKDACLRDNCRYGANYGTLCQWEDTYPEIGRGICYSEDTSNSKYCEMCNINNPVFYNQDCTQDVCNLLGQCIADEQETLCMACSITTTCADLSGNEYACIGRQEYSFAGYPQLANIQCDSSTIIHKSDDVCGIGFCKWTGSQCIKDANDDGIYDCIDYAGDVSCDQDRSVPSTLYTSQNFISMKQNLLSFQVDDGTAKTYYCFSEEGEYCCPNSLVNGNSVSIPNVDYDIVNFEGTKTLWYYSASLYGNPEPIKNISIYIDNKPPMLDVTYTVVNSTLGASLSDLTLTISSHETALNCEDRLSGPMSMSQLGKEVIDTTRTVTFPGLIDGSYIYHIKCEDIYGNVNDTVYIEILVDRMRLLRDPKPNFVTLPASVVNFSVISVKKQLSCHYAQKSPLQLSEKKYPILEPTGSDFFYLDPEIDLVTPGTYEYDIICYDDDSKQSLAARTSIIFTIDMTPPDTKIYVERSGDFLSIDPDRFYTNPLILLNCTDPIQGPPREFGCSSIKYCISTISCSPSIAISNQSYQFRPVVETSGKYYLCVQSEDKGGNKEQPHCQTINIDLDPPVLQIDSPGNNNVIGITSFLFNGRWFDQRRPVIMTAKIVNERGFQMNVNSLLVAGEEGTGTFSGTAVLNPLFAGLNTLTVIAIDASGNYNTASVNFYYDIYPPKVDRARIYGEDIVDRSQRFVISGDVASDVEIKLDYFLLTEDQNILRHHEYGNRLKAELNVNDYQFLDRSNSFGTDVNATAVISSNDSSFTNISATMIYNSSANNYYAVFWDLLDLGNYTMTYLFQDTFGNSDTYSHPFYVNDTLAPYFEIKIFDSQGNNITEVQYGTYEVKIYASEPIKKLHYLNYSFSGKTKYIELLDTNGTEMRGLLTISPSDLDLRNLRQQQAILSIYGEDMHGLGGSIITTIRQFRITTIGPMQPEILTPDISTSLIHYSSTPNYTIEGMVYKNDNVGLRDGDIMLMRNQIFGDFTDANWFLGGQAVTEANDFFTIWEPRRFGDKITLKNNNTINLHDYENAFLAGRYYEFRTRPIQNRDLYKILSRTFTNKDGVKDLYDIVSENELIGFGSMTPGSQFEDTIYIWSNPNPDGWFNVNVTLEEGANHFYARAFDGANEGQYSQIFTIVYDTLPPKLINTSPADGTVTGSLDVPIYAFVDGTGSNISNFITTKNGSLVQSVLTYDENGYAKISYQSSVSPGTYLAGLIVSDMAGNTLSYDWVFTIDPSAPSSPDINPSGMINDRTPLVEIKFHEDVLIEDAIIEGEGYILNLTPLLSKNGNVYTYKIPENQALPSDGDYQITVSAKKLVGDDYGDLGVYKQSFVLDRTPPRIIQTNDPIVSDTLPVYGYVKTDERALCRFGFYDVAYDNLPYRSRIIQYQEDHILPIYELDKLDSKIYVRCIDQAGNRMTSSEEINIVLSSLLYPAPKIHIPETTLEVLRQNAYTVIGSTFDSLDPLQWVPDVNVQIAKSSLFYTNDVDFEQKFSTRSLPDINMRRVSPPNGFTVDLATNSIIMTDMPGVFIPGYFVDFVNNRRKDYTLYEIKSVIELQGSNNIMVSFFDDLPLDLDTSAIMYVYDQKAPPGWFDYNLNLVEGNNFFYAAAINKFGVGTKTQVYNLIRDNSDPILKNEFPRNGEIISEESLEISIIADGIYSRINQSEFVLNGLPVNPQITYIKDFESKVSYDTTQGNGLHTVYVKAYDSAQNSADFQWSFTIDASVPIRPAILPNKPINDSTPLIDIQFSEDVNIQSVRVVSEDGSVNMDITSLIPSTGNLFRYQTTNPLCADGEEIKYNTQVRASKLTSNNVGYWYQPWVCDLKPPIITKIPTEISTNSIPVKFYMETDEDSKCRFTERGPTIGYHEMENELSSQFQRNHYVAANTLSTKTSIYIRCIDVAGNVMTNSRVISINEGESDISICGDGQITGNEQCDGSNWGSIRTCNDINSAFFGGTLSCDPVTCQFDTTGCLSPSCNTDNDCDIGQVCVDNKCRDITVSCTDASDCLPNQICVDGICIDEGQPLPFCGNNIVDPGETCDGTDFGRVKGCEDLPGFKGGILSCNNLICQFDTSQCIPDEPVCGNGIVEPGEECDGQLSLSCQDFGFEGGNIACTNCKIDTSGCEGEIGVCGDGILNKGEQCDPPTMSMIYCTEFSDSFIGGQLSCDNCRYSTELCIPRVECGDGIISSGEECDGGIGEASCNLFDRFRGGILTCGDDCYYDTSLCIKRAPACNDGILDAGEQCEPSLPITVSCSQFGDFKYGEITCNSECRYDLSGCSKDPIVLPGCGNGRIDEILGEQCEQDIIVRSCRDLGFNIDGMPGCYPPGSANECQYDTSPCGGNICSGSETKECNLLNPVYVDGLATCQNNFFNMDKCWSLNRPIISLESDFVVNVDRIDIKGTVSNTRKLELFVNGALVDSWINIDDNPKQYPFSFNNVFLSRSTPSSDGKNDIRLIAYGVFPTINTTFDRSIINDQEGPLITIIEPKNLRSKTEYPKIVISTSKPSECVITYQSVNNQVVQTFATNNDVLHDVVLNSPLLKDQDNEIFIDCIDFIGNQIRHKYLLYVDTIKPIILDVTLFEIDKIRSADTAADKKYVIYDYLDSQIIARVDSNAICKYGINNYNYNNMILYDSSISLYSSRWTSSSNVISELDSFKIITICEDEAGWLSEPYEMEVIVDLFAGIEIVSLVPEWVNRPQPNLNITTNRIANCTMEYDGVKHQMIRNVINSQYNYNLNVQVFNNLELNENIIYNFKVVCVASGISPSEKMISVKADYTIPFIDITYPNNNDVFNVDKIVVQLRTEPLSTVSIYINDNLVIEDTYTTTGTASFDVFLDKGKNVISASAIDKAGNTNMSSIDIYYDGENTRPVIRGLYPEKNALLQSINNRTLVAYVETSFGAGLNLDKSDIILKNQFGSIITGTKGFVRGDPITGIGNFTFTISNALPDGDYTWEIHVVDEFNNEGQSDQGSFTISREVPSIILESPVYSYSGIVPTSQIRTNISSFDIEGFIETLSPIIEAEYDLRKLVNSEFVSIRKANLSFYPDGTRFKNTVLLESLIEGQLDRYELIISVRNSANYEAKLPLIVVYDLEPPEVERVVIE
ncbi:MAG: hypothetical protein ACMXYG_07175 [Candidatus Woesearchaeota archaeon]